MSHARLPCDHSRRNSVAGSTILRVRRNPSQTFWTAGRLRRGPVRSPPSQRRSPRFPPACAPCLRCHATGLAPDTVLRRSTPFDEGLRPSAEDRVVLRPALRRIPSPGGQRPSTGELRGAATGLTPDTVVRRSTPFDEGLRPSAEQLPPSTGELRGAATGLTPDTVARRSTPFDEGLRGAATGPLRSSMPISHCFPDAPKTTVKFITNRLDKTITTEYNSIVNKKRAIGRSPCGKEGRCL